MYGTGTNELEFFRQDEINLLLIARKKKNKDWTRDSYQYIGVLTDNYKEGVCKPCKSRTCVRFNLFKILELIKVKHRS